MHLDFIEALPALAIVLAAIKPAVVARGGDTQRRIERIGLGGRDLHVAPVGRGREAADFHVLPGLAVVGGAEQAHAQRHDRRFRIGWIDRDCVTVEHSLGRSVAHELALEMLSFGKLDQPVTAVAPVIAAVGRAHHAVDLESGVDIVRLLRVLGKAHHARGERPLAVRADLGCRELAPARTSVLAAIDVDRRGTGQHLLRIAAVDHEAPDLPALVRKVRAFEGRAGVCADPDTVIGAGEDLLRVARMHEDGVGLDAAQHMLPVAAAGSAAEDAGLARMIGLSEVAGDAHVDVR